MDCSPGEGSMVHYLRSIFVAFYWVGRWDGGIFVGEGSVVFLLT